MSLLCCAFAWVKFSCCIKPFPFSKCRHLSYHKGSILSFTHQNRAKQFLTQNFKNTVMPTPVCQLYIKVICMSNSIEIISSKAEFNGHLNSVHLYLWVVDISGLAVQTTWLMMEWVWNAPTLAQHFFHNVEKLLRVYCYTFIILPHLQWHRN